MQPKWPNTELDHLGGRLTIRAGALAEQDKPVEEILLAAKEVTSTSMRRFINYLNIKDDKLVVR